MYIDILKAFFKIPVDVLFYKKQETKRKKENKEQKTIIHITDK